MEESWKRRWPKVVAVLLVCLLIFQDNVLTTLADAFHISITLKDNETSGILDKTGVDISLIGIDDPTVSANGVTEHGVANLTVSANEGDRFYVSVGDADRYAPVDENPEITVSSGDNDFELPMQTPAPVRHTVTFAVQGEGTGEIRDEYSGLVSGEAVFYDDATVWFMLTATNQEQGPCHIAGVVIDDVPVVKEWNNSDIEYKVTLGDAKNHTVVVFFEKNVYTVTVSSGDNGSARIENPSDKYYYGDSFDVLINAAEGYNVDSVSENGTDILASLTAGTGLNDYVVSAAVAGDVVIEVGFVPIEKKEMEDAGVSFNDEDAYDKASDEDSDYYFYKNNGIVCFEAEGEISINGEKNGQDNPNSWKTQESAELYKILVRERDSLKWQEVKLEKNIKLVIDKDAPVVMPIATPDPEWTNHSAYQVIGTVKDEDSREFPASGIAYAVYNDEVLTAAQVAAGEGNRLVVSGEGEYTFTVSGEQVRTYYVWAVDKAGNVSEKSESVCVKIDRTNPAITGFNISNTNNTPFGSFYNNKVSVKVMATDGEGSGLDTIILYLDEKVYKTAKPDESGAAVFEIPASQVLDETMHLNKEISAKATDKVGNVTADFVIPTEKNSNIKSSRLMIETIRPTVSIAASAEANYTDEQNRVFFAKPVSLRINVSDTVTGEENNSGIREVSVSVNGIELEKDANGKSFDRLERAYDKTKISQDSFVVGMSQIDVPEDGKYEISVEVTDNAGNVKTESTVVYLDKSAPTIVSFDFQAENYVEGDEEKLSALVTDYGFYFMQDTAVIIMAKDEVTSSGIRSLTYYTVDNNKGRSQETTVTANSDGSIRVVIPAEFKGQIYARATDNAGNTTEVDVNPNSAIIESPALHASEEHIAIGMGSSAGTDNSGYPLYSGNVDVDITITDTWSGIRSISWTVSAPYDDGENQSGEVGVLNDGTLSGDGGWNISRKEANLVLEMEKGITIQNNSNAIVLSVTMTDRAGNVSTQEQTISIDKTAPSISVSFDNMTPDEEYNAFYKENRTATIVITERNFSASNVQCTMTNTDGWLPNVDLTAPGMWEESRDDANPDQSTYTARISFTEDGDFTLDVAFADNCGNGAASPETQIFTIDKTLPVVRVTYDNNTALNGNYYSVVRTATITVTEHNFDANRIQIIGSSTDNGTEKSFPKEAGWSNRGDEYTASIQYYEDGRYTFSIQGMDKAGNLMEDYAPEEFYVDLTNPQIKIDDVEDKTPYNGKVAPVIEVTDTNIDKVSVEMVLTGVNNGKFTMKDEGNGKFVLKDRDDKIIFSGSYEEIENGRKYTFDNFAEDKQIDDIYTLKISLNDFAGREAEENTEITFSVNRHGSVYTFDSPKREEILGRYIREEQDIILTETNVNELERDTFLIKLMKNGVPTDLQRDKDYTVAANAGEGQWCQYTYTIKAALFAEDGTYTISVYSIDMAGNVNENIADDKYFDSEKNIKAEISFGVDKTAPVIVPIDLESNAQYKEEVKKAFVEVKDNLVLAEVQIKLNGSIVDYEVEGETYSFQIPESTETQEVEILAYDAAGNVNGVEIMGLMVSTSSFALWFHNTPLFVGSIAGAVGVAGAGGGVGTALFRRKKRKFVK